MRWALLVLALQLVTPRATVNPSQVTFGASPDHGTAIAGHDIVSAYDLAYLRSGATVYVEHLGKPAREANNAITVPISAQARTRLTRNVEYTVQITTIGPGGSSAGPLSNGFKFTR